MHSSGSHSMLEERWPNDLLAPRKARTALAAYAAMRLDENQLASALLLTTELVTNVVQHTSGPFILRAVIDIDVLTVEVEDCSSGAIHVSTPSDHDENGRGLQIIDAIATRWGTTRTDAGKRVWFEIPRRCIPSPV